MTERKYSWTNFYLNSETVIVNIPEIKLKLSLTQQTNIITIP
jgi:hypothetical protein